MNPWADENFCWMALEIIPIDNMGHTGVGLSILRKPPSPKVIFRHFLMFQAKFTLELCPQTRAILPPTFLIWCHFWVMASCWR